MKLRTRLALGFAAASLLPLAIVLPIAQSNLRRILAADADARMATARATAQAVLSQKRAHLESAVRELAEGLAADEVPRRDSAARWMALRSLDVLSLLDEAGKTLSSGHLPARLGDDDAPLKALPSNRTSLARIELQGETGLLSSVALVAKVAVQAEEKPLALVGGLLLGQKMAEDIRSLTGGQVEIWEGNELLASAGEAASPTLSADVSVESGAWVRLFQSQKAAATARRQLGIAFGALAVSGLVLSLLLGFVLSRRITSPVEALTEGARRLSLGEKNLRVQAKASGELEQLIFAFNKMAADLQDATAKLLSAERVAAWQEVAKRLAHEIKNPLTPIQMSLETLMAASRSDAQSFLELFPKAAPLILEEVARLSRTIGEFSKFARLPKPELAPMDLAIFTSELLQLYAPASPSISVEVKLEGPLPVLADKNQLTQIGLNLLRNAEEALASGGHVWVSARASSGFALLEVADDGPGISPGDRERIFEPYATTKANGTGLGLAIARRIAEEHGGTLAAGERAGGGGLFSLAVPLASPQPNNT
jgi:signal transduction histidine kinase